MPYLRIALFLLFPIFLNGQISAHFGAPKFAPADGKKLLIIGQDLGAVGGLDLYSEGYVDQVDTPVPAGITTYTGLPGLGGLVNLDNWGAGDVHAQAYVEDETFDNSAIVIGLYISGALSGINGGFFNNSIRTLANWVKTQIRPVFLRIGYEFDGPWNGHNPTEFRNAWRHIVQIFDEEEVKNVAYVWQSAGINTPNISQWYPGDEYVNWLGYSHFDQPNPGQSIRNFAEEHDKPIMIAEATPRIDLGQGSGAGHWQSWFYPLFQSIYANDRIKALAYINTNWQVQPQWIGQGWGDSRVQIDAYVKNTWENEIAKDPWITASDTLFDYLQLQTWLDSMIVLNTPKLEKSNLSIFQDTESLNINSTDQLWIDQVLVWNYQGRLIYQTRSKQTQYRIPLQQLPSGGVIIQVLKNGNLHTQRLIHINVN